jgi:putative ABC transport system permease protein
MLNKLSRRLSMLLRRRRFDADLAEEMRLHRELREREEIERGLSAEEAHYAAQRRFGNDLVLREESRDIWGWTWLENSLHDVHYAWRTLVKNPGFAAIAVLTLGLGIGANTAIFTFVDASLLEPLPYPDAGKIVFIAERPPHSSDLVNVHPFNFLQWQARARSFDALALMQSIPANTMGPEGAEQLSGLWTTAGLFRVFGVSPALGRGFTEDETVAVGDPPEAVGHVAIISHALWQQRFASDPNIIGKHIQLYGEANTVIGVMPAGFRAGVFNPDLYLPMPIDRQKPDSIGSHSFVCYGRLRAGVDLAAARAEMNVIAARLGREYPMDQDWTTAVLSLRNHLTIDSRPVLLLLQGVVAFILLIVCSNVAGLLLTRSIGRRSGPSPGKLGQPLALPYDSKGGFPGAPARGSSRPSHFGIHGRNLFVDDTALRVGSRLAGFAGRHPNHDAHDQPRSIGIPCPSALGRDLGYLAGRLSACSPDRSGVTPADFFASSQCSVGIPARTCSYHANAHPGG